MKKKLLLTFVCLFQLSCTSTGVIGNSENINSEYDRFEDQTVYETPELRLIAPTFFQSLSSNKQHTLDLSAAVICEGEDLCKPEQIALYFTSSSKSWEYLRSRDLNMIIDGKTYDYGEIERTSSVLYGSVAEVLYFFMTYDDFYEFAYAEDVEMRLGFDELQLLKNERQIFRNMVSLINETE